MAASPATRCSIRTTKTFTYFGGPKVWTNTYHFSEPSWGGTTSDWDTLAANIAGLEADMFPSTVTIEQVDFFNAGSDLSIYTKALTVTGDLTITGGEQAPGDVALMMRYSTDQRSSKNRPIYLYNWYHAAVTVGGSSPDQLLAAQISAADALASDMIAGFSLGGENYVRSGPRGAVAQSHVTPGFARHRDFPRD